MTAAFNAKDKSRLAASISEFISMVKAVAVSGSVIEQVVDGD
jgi:hypothetical protein